MAAVKGAEASIAAVEAAVDEDAAVGIIGHEQGAVIAAIVAAVGLLGSAVGLSLIRELGPVLTGLLVVGRAGSATAAFLREAVEHCKHLV